MTPKDLMEKVRDACHAQTCCLHCPLFSGPKEKPYGRCLVVAMPFAWDLEAIAEALGD